MPLPAVVDGRRHASFAEHTKVTRDRRSADRVVGREIDDARRPASEPLDQRTAHRVGDRLEVIHVLLVTHELPIGKGEAVYAPTGRASASPIRATMSSLVVCSPGWLGFPSPW